MWYWNPKYTFSYGIRSLNNGKYVLQIRKDVIGFDIIYVYVEKTVGNPEIVDPSEIGTNFNDDDDDDEVQCTGARNEKFVIDEEMDIYNEPVEEHVSQDVGGNSEPVEEHVGQDIGGNSELIEEHEIPIVRGNTKPVKEHVSPNVGGNTELTEEGIDEEYVASDDSMSIMNFNILNHLKR